MFGHTSLSSLEEVFMNSQILSLVEKLIKELPSVQADWSNGDANLIEKNSMSFGTSLQHVENGTNLREAQSMLLERIASEMNRLKFYIAHAQYRTCLSLGTWRRGFRVPVNC